MDGQDKRVLTMWTQGARTRDGTSGFDGQNIIRSAVVMAPDHQATVNSMIEFKYDASGGAFQTGLVADGRSKKEGAGRVGFQLSFPGRTHLLLNLASPAAHH
jgi:hypothetical protein